MIDATRAGMYPILYSFRRCPYAIRARMALRQAGVVIELREVALRDKPEQLCALSPKATVPVLQCPDGRVLDESLDIMRWALQHNDPDGWLGAADSPDQRRLLDCNDGAFKPALDRYKYAERHPEHQREQYREHAEAALIGELENRLRTQAFVGGATVGLVDVAVVPFVRQFAAVDPAWFEHSRWSHTRRWLRRWLADPAFTQVMGKTAAWMPGQLPHLINRSTAEPGDAARPAQPA